jgi:hypothetical protein
MRPFICRCYEDMPLQEMQATQEQQTIQNLCDTPRTILRLWIGKYCCHFSILEIFVTSKATHQDSILEILLQHPLTHITQSCVESRATHQNKYGSNQQVHTCHTHSQNIAVARTQWQSRTYEERLADIFLLL